MSVNVKTMMVLGGSGFIGRRVIREAVRAGWRVMALARSDAASATVAAAGGIVVRGEAAHPDRWLNAVDGAEVIIDLIQPARPKRLGRRQLRQLSAQRQSFTACLLEALRAQGADRRPQWVAVSGIDDLAPDADGVLSASSPLRDTERGFNPVGIPVRRLIEHSGLKASFVYLGSVYGPGGPFGDAILPAIAAGRWKDFGSGSDRMILIHVDDAARGLVRIADLARDHAAEPSSVLTDAEPVTMTAFCALAAAQLGVEAPGRIPQWLAALVAGKPLVETSLHREAARATLGGLDGYRLRYPSYREGLPATLQALGLLPTGRRVPGG